MMQESRKSVSRRVRHVMGLPRRVAFIAANPAGARNGNEITTQRLATGLRARGISVEILRPGEPVASMVGRLARGPRRPELVHAFHARRSGPRGFGLARALRVPLVTSVTGTDLAVDLQDPARASDVRASLGRSRAVVCGHANEAAQVRDLVDDDALIVVATKGVDVPDALPPATLSKRPGEVLVLQVAHVRRVKNNRLALDAVARVRDSGRDVRLVLLGDVLDEDYAAELARAAGAEWTDIHHAAVPHDAVGGYFASVDIVLNTSDAEGGSNAILEAMAHGRAVVAAGIQGNVAYVGADASRGLLYPVDAAGTVGTVQHDLPALVELLTALADDAPRRASLGRAARSWVRTHHGLESEIDAVLGAYDHALTSD